MAYTGITLVHASEDPFTPKEMSKLDKGDIQFLNAGLGRYGVISGCAVTAQGTPDGTLAVASGVVEAAGVAVTVTSGNVNVLSGAGSTAADGTNGRFDLIVVSNVGVKSVVFGTPGSGPVFPISSLPATSVVLAAVYIPATDTTIESNQLIDKRVFLASRAKQVILPIDLRSAGTNVAWTDLALTAWLRGAHIFTTNLDGNLDGIATVPRNLAPTPNASIVLVTGHNATTGVVRWIVSCARVANGASYNPASLTAETAQEITIPGTARLRQDVTFPLTNLGAPAAAEELIVRIQHNGAHANDTAAVDSELLDAFLVCDVV